MEECCAVRSGADGEGEHEAVTQSFFQCESSTSSGIFQRQVEHKQRRSCWFTPRVTVLWDAQVPETCELEHQNKKELPFEGG